jgi:tight adherence protein B
VSQLLPIAVALGAALSTLLVVLAVGRAALARQRVLRRTRRVLNVEAAGTVAGSTTGRALVRRFLGRTIGQRISALLLLLAPALLIGGGLLLSWVQGALLAVGALSAAVWLARYERARRQARLERQLVPALRLMAAATESGFSVQQALERVAVELPAPIAEEFGQTIRLIALGVSLEDALAELAARGGESFGVFSHIVTVQYRIGGNLPGLLLGLAANLAERLQFEDEVRALTAQTRYSGWILSVLPFGFLAAVALLSPSYVQVLFHTPSGRTILAVSAAVLAVGLLSIRAISRVEL